ncbi:MAG: hypothetical protein EOR73_19145 [Mesorhizobium sp.]|nr:MAG: hypothetical protein EOR73_19145 [Mesorhizobium sp.]
MIVLLDHCFRARTIAASMAIHRPKATGAAPACGPQRQRRMVRERLCCFREEWAQPRGRK